MNALIKRGSIHLQLDAPEASVADFKKAIDIDDKNSDIFHHRGQVRSHAAGQWPYWRSCEVQPPW